MANIAESNETSCNGADTVSENAIVKRNGSAKNVYSFESIGCEVSFGVNGI